LTDNESGKFEDRWIYLKPVSRKCIFTHGVDHIVYYPVAHAEGNFIPANHTVLNALKANDQIVFKYVDSIGKPAKYPWNPNGSIENIAGICDVTGRIFGLMPHPERHFHPLQHPRWTREGLKSEADGKKIFQNAVDFIRNNF
ncbi:MAG: phosphoribosylformylglycinamidine synthase subunit PurQ, partial [bacterium]|nr:phosphoribosylformylglycinamidine synthase subunit PurQ [bacterium]